MNGVERTGPETYVHLRKGDSDLVSRLVYNENLQVNQKMRFSFDPNAVHLFDVETGENLSRLQN